MSRKGSDVTRSRQGSAVQSTADDTVGSRDDALTCESDANESGTLFGVVDAAESKWKHIIEAHIGPAARLVACSSHSANRRIYELNGLIYKVVTVSELAYRNSLADEYKILDGLSGLGCVPEVVSYSSYSDCSILELRQSFGEQIGQIGDHVSTKRLSLWSLCRAYLSLNRAGVCHRDAHFGNILILPDGLVQLLDFDQAVRTSPTRAFIGDFFGVGPDAAIRPLNRLLLKLMYVRLPLAIRKRLRPGAFVNKLHTRDKRIAQSPDPREEVGDLDKLWSCAASSDASSPGDAVGYYSVAFGDKVMRGERSWEPRWQAISRAIDFRGKRLLELGCNLGLLSCYAYNAGASPQGVGVDHHQSIIEAARDFAKMARVPVSYSVIDFDLDERWEAQIQVDQFDVVSALSVSHWLSDKYRFFSFLGRFPQLLYEGHDSVAVEVRRLQSFGFTDIRVVTVSERGRCVLLASR